MSARATVVKLLNKLEIFINPATEESVVGVRPLSGTGTNGSITLAVANTWYQVPATIPSAPYHLVISKEVNNGDIRFSGNNVGIAGSSNGNKLITGTLVAVMSAGRAFYISSSVAGDIVNWQAIII